jgi:hypothetical protein
VQKETLAINNQLIVEKRDYISIEFNYEWKFEVLGSVFKWKTIKANVQSGEK